MNGSMGARIAGSALALCLLGCGGSDDDPAPVPAPDTASMSDVPVVDVPLSDDTPAAADDGPTPADEGGEDTGAACTAMEKFCKGLDVFICKANGVDFDFVKTCEDDELCMFGECLCQPDCANKECGDSGCGGSCGECAEGSACQPDGTCTCVPSCEGKECGDDGCGGPCGGCADGVLCSPNGICGCVPSCEGKECGDDGCGGTCGACAGGKACSPNGKCDCTPDCTGLTCGWDGCGGLCNGCLDLSFDDGTTDTAYGYGTEPSTQPKKLACLVRFELPLTKMRLLRFTAGWMYGLYNLQIPFELVYADAGDFDCTKGGEGAWYLEYCEAKADVLQKIGDFVPKEPYEPMEAAELGEVTLPSKSVFVGALFDLTKGGGACTVQKDCPAGYHCDCGEADPCAESAGTCTPYPVFTCPLDKAGQGANSFMMPVYTDDKGELVLEGGPFQDKEANEGVVPFRIRVQKTEESMP